MLRPPEVVEEFGYTNELVTGSRTMLSMIVDAESMSMHASDFRRKNAGGGLTSRSKILNSRASFTSEATARCA